MSLRRGEGWGGMQLYKIFTSHMNSPIGHTKGHFKLQTPQNAAKSIPGINIHLAGRFQPVGHLLASTRPGPFKEHLCARGHQTGHRNKPWKKQTKEEWTVKEPSIVS